MKSKVLGGSLLIVGTSIGAGMLGLPIAAAQLGFPGAFILLITCWLISMFSGFIILEVNCWLPPNSNIISMAKITLGPWGQLIAWITYIALLYSLLCAYISGGSDLLHNVLMSFKIDIPTWSAAIIFTLTFGSIVYFGIHSVDRANRILMTLKFATFFILIALLIPFMSLDKLVMGNLSYIGSNSTIMVTIVSFGWTILIPSLRVYFNENITKLRLAIFIGSSIPLICYIIWDVAIIGAIPLVGTHSLLSIFHSSTATGDLVSTLSNIVGNNGIILFIKTFTSICVLTSFLGVALCLTDFFADGLALEKKGMGNIIIYSLTFIPAAGVAMFIPKIFIRALEYAGIYCTILLITMPALMAWRGRYHLNLAQSKPTLGGKFLLIMLMLSSIIAVISSIMH